MVGVQGGLVIPCFTSRRSSIIFVMVEISFLSHSCLNSELSAVVEDIVLPMSGYLV